jgi:hypothetical protein
VIQALNTTYNIDNNQTYDTIRDDLYVEKVVTFGTNLNIDK